VKVKGCFVGVVLFLASFCSIAFSQPGRYREAIELGVGWFLNNQNIGFLYYQYNTATKTYLARSHSLRELASLWAFAKTANFLNDQKLKAVSREGFAYFERFIRYDGRGDFYFLNITPESIKLAYSAFMILTLLEINHEKKDFYLKRFAKGIISMQNPDGSLRTLFYSDKQTGVNYYPGEALFALMSLYEYEKDQRYLAVARKAFDYYVRYWRKNKSFPFIPWQTRAYCKLYYATGREEIADFVFEMSDYFISQHLAPDNRDAFKFPRGISTAVYLEGINAAWKLAEIRNDSGRLERYNSFIRQGMDFVLSLQIKNSDDEKTIGGFLSSPRSTKLRVDNNQHALMALMEACESGVLEPEGCK